MYCLRDINDIREDGNFRFQHCFREANAAADVMANEAVQTEGTFIFDSLATIPRFLRGHLRTQHIPCIRT